MWILNWLPDWIFYLITASGVVALSAGMFLKGIPVVGKYQIPVLFVGAILTVVGIWYLGGIAKDREYRERIAEMQVKIAEAEKKAAEENTKIEYVYRDKIKVVEKVRYEVIGSIRESASELDANCYVIPQAVEILNKAASSSTATDTSEENTR